MPKSQDEWFIFLEKFIQGIGDLKEPLNSLASKTQDSLDPGGFKIDISDSLVKKVVQSVGKTFVKKLKGQNIFQDVLKIIDVILNRDFFGQIKNFIGGGPMMVYVTNTANNLLRFLQTNVFIQ